MEQLRGQGVGEDHTHRHAQQVQGNGGRLLVKAESLCVAEQHRKAWRKDRQWLSEEVREVTGAGTGARG